MTEEKRVGVYEAPDSGGWKSYMNFHTAYVHLECAVRVKTGESDYTIADTISDWIYSDQTPESVNCEICGCDIKEEAG